MSTPAPTPETTPRESRTGLLPWTVGELAAPPRRNWRQLLGPGIVMAGASLGAGEWLIGPAITARYGGLASVEDYPALGLQAGDRLLEEGPITDIHRF